MKRVRRTLVVLALMAAMVVTFAPIASAHPDFCVSGSEFGAFHSATAQVGGIGGEGHIPGGHRGFALCTHDHDWSPGSRQGPK